MRKRKRGLLELKVVKIIKHPTGLCQNREEFAKNGVRK